MRVNRSLGIAGFTIAEMVISVLMVRAGACLPIYGMRVERIVLVAKELSNQVRQKVLVQSLAVPVLLTTASPEVDH